MTERDYTRRLAKLFNAVDGAVFRTLPDSGIKGHKKPYDAFLLYNGRHYSIEAKIGRAALEPHQITALAEDAEAGAKFVVVRYSSTNVTLYGSSDGGLDEKTYTVSWKDLATPDGIDALLTWMVLV